MTLDEAAKTAWTKYRKGNDISLEEVDVWEERAFIYAYKLARLEERGRIVEHLRTVYAQNCNARDFADLIEKAPHAEGSE